MCCMDGKIFQIFSMLVNYVCSCSVHLIVCCVHCYAARLIIAFVDVNKLILSYLS